MNRWVEIKSNLNWSGEIEISPAIEEQIIVIPVFNSTNLGEEFYMKIISEPRELKYVVCSLEELTDIDEEKIINFKSSIAKLSENGIEVNLVGATERISKALKDQSVIPILIPEQNNFKQLSNCMLSISFK